MRRVLLVIALLAGALVLWWWPAPAAEPIVPLSPRAAAAEPPPAIAAAPIDAAATGATSAPAARDDATPPPRGEYAARVHGRVLLGDGTPAAGATVLAGANATTAGADGAYSVPLAMTFHPLRAWLAGHQPVEIVKVGKAPAVAAGRALDIVLPARAATIDGVVVGPDGAPRAGWHAALRGDTIDVGDTSRARLCAEDFAAGAVAAATADGEPQVDPNHVVLPDDGSFRFGGLRHGHSYGLVLWHDATVQVAWADAMPAGTTGHRFVARDLTSQRVESRVVDRKNAPIAGVRVRLFVAIRSENDLRVAAETRTDGDGHFVFERAPVFDWHMVLDGAGVVPQTETRFFDTPIRLAGQRRFRFDADAYAPAPTALRALDEKGRALPLVREAPNGGSEQGRRLRWPGDDAWREILVSDEAAWLVLEADGRELRRLPLRLDRDRTTIVRG